MNMLETISDAQQRERDTLCKQLVGSLLYFTQVFYHLRTGRLFELSFPVGRESHYISISRALTAVIDGKIKRLKIHVPPRYGKTEMVIHAIAWSLAQYPDSNYIYTSYSHTLAKKQTQTIRDIIMLPAYRDMFGVKIKDDASAKDNFETTAGGSIYAVGGAGSITGHGAGIKSAGRFGGFIVIDDIIKPDEAPSDTIREGINEWYENTLQSRINSPDTPIIYIGQRVHERDLAAKLTESGEWTDLVLPALDEAGNALHPKMHDVKTLLKMKETMLYTFAAQYQQDPQPAGGGIFKAEWFKTLEYEPKILATFITVDTAESEKNYSDATVFSFWGIYKPEQYGIELDVYALHWISCVELRIEPKDLQFEFLQFYKECMHHAVKPQIVAIEKKSTGTTLLSTLQTYQGLRVIQTQRRAKVGELNVGRWKNKVACFLEAQYYVSQGLVSLPLYAEHTKMCIEHCRKITANNSHRYDDIADTMYDAIKIALIDKTLINLSVGNQDYNSVARDLMSHTQRVNNLKQKAYAR